MQYLKAIMHLGITYGVSNNSIKDQLPYKLVGNANSNYANNSKD